MYREDFHATILTQCSISVKDISGQAACKQGGEEVKPTMKAEG
jgi:hypothetical protein